MVAAAVSGCGGGGTAEGSAAIFSCKNGAAEMPLGKEKPRNLVAAAEKTVMTAEKVMVVVVVVAEEEVVVAVAVDLPT